MQLIDTLLIVCLLTTVIHTAETLSYSVRLAGVKLNKIAVALSLSGIIVLVSRTANMLQGPLTAHFVDYAKTDSSFPLLEYLRFILLASSVGTLLAIVLFPTFVNLFMRLIAKLEVAGSLPKLITSVTIGQLANTKHYIRKPAFKLRQFRYLGVPKRFLLLNVFITAIYTVGVMSSLYAAHLNADHGIASSQSSGIINGIATVLLTIFIDPRLGLITDKALNDEGSRNRLGKVYALLMGTRFVGTLLGQALIVPAASFIGMIVKWI